MKRGINNCDRERKKQREIEQDRHNSIAITELGVDFLVDLNCMHFNQTIKVIWIFPHCFLFLSIYFNKDN